MSNVGYDGGSSHQISSTQTKYHFGQSSIESSYPLNTSSQENVPSYNAIALSITHHLENSKTISPF